MRQRRWRAVLVLQILVGVVACCWAIGRKSFWTDEGFSYVAAHRPFGSLLRLVSFDETNMGAYYVFLHFWQHLGDSEGTLRLPSAIAAVATIPLLAVVVDRTYGRRAAVVAGFLLAVSPMAVMYAQEARSYAMLALATTASMLLFLRLVECGGRWTALGYVVVTGIGVYLHFFAAFVVAAQLLSLLVVPDWRAAVRRVAVPVGAVVVLSLPLVIAVLTGPTDQISWIRPTSFASVESTGRWFSGDFRTRPWVLALWSLLLLVAAAWTVRAVLVARRNGDRVRTTEQWRRAAMWSWLLVPIVLTAVLSLRQPVWVDRYLIVSLPAFVGLAAVGLTRWVRPWATAVVAGLVVALSVSTLLDYYPSHQRWSADWRAADAQLRAEAAPTDAVLFAPTYGRNMLRYYDDRRAAAGARSSEDNAGAPLEDVLLAPGDAFDGRMKARTATPALVRERVAAGSGPVWLVEERTGSPDVSRCAESLGLRRVATQSFGIVHLVRLERGPLPPVSSSPGADPCLV